MPNDPVRPSGLLSDISQSVEPIIRHMLPGVLVVGGAYLAYPETFREVHIGSWQHLMVLAVVTVTVGNALFALNRCGVHQAVEYIFYLWNIKGPIPQAGRRDYTNDLANYVVESFQTGDPTEPIRRHISLRVSTGFLLLTLSETALFFSWFHSDYSVLHVHKWVLPVVCVIAFIAYLWQFWITRRIDYFVVHPEKKQRSLLV